MLSFLGDTGLALHHSYGQDMSTWLAFRAEVQHMYPDVPAWTSKVAADGQRLDSVPERLTYEAIRRALPEAAVLSVHKPIHPAAGKRTADFTVAMPSGDTLRIEAIGMIARGAAPSNATQELYSQRLAAKFLAYAAAGMPPPVTIYGNEIADPDRLRETVRQTLAAIGGAGHE